MARFLWTNADGAARTLTLARKLMFRDGSYSGRRTRYLSVGLDQRTMATELVVGSGAEVVVARARFEPKPRSLLTLLEDAASGAELTYEDDALEQFPFLRLEHEGPVVPIAPDTDRFGFGEWEAELGLRTVGGNSLARLFPGFVPTALSLPGTDDNSASTPDATALDLAGDIELRIAAALNDWTPAATVALIDKKSSLDGYALRLDTAGRLVLTYGDGSTSYSDVATSALTVNDGELLLVRAALDLDDGASNHEARFWQKTSTVEAALADLRAHTGWTLVGSAVTTAGAIAALGTNAQRLVLGNDDAGSLPADGKLYAALALDGIAGTEAFLAALTDLIPGIREFRERVNGAVVTVNRSGSPAAAVVPDS